MANYGHLGYTFPPGYFGNDPNSIRASNIFQAGITGATGMSLSTGLYPVPWNAPQITVGSGIMQATSVGTGSAWISVASGGIYEIDYTLGITGSSQAVYDVFCTINGTGLSASGVLGGASCIDASASHISASTGGSGTAQTSQRCMVPLAGGSVLTLWVSIATGTTQQAIMQTGTHIGIRQVG